MSDDSESLKKHMKTYTLVGGALLFFTLVTVAMSYVHLGSHGMNIFVGMVIATIKAGLVALIFMHLNHEKRTIYRILLFTFFFALGLMALTLLALGDPVFFPGFNK